MRTLIFSLLATAAIPAQQQDILFRAERLVVAPDTVLENGSFLVRDGRVLHVGDEIPQALRESAKKETLSGTVVPGFVAMHTHLGQSADLAERAFAFTPALRAADAFDPFGKALENTGESGVTTAGLAPTSINVFAGIAAAVQPGNGMGTVLEADSYLKITLVGSARKDQQRFPTSLMGAAELARSAFEASADPLRGKNAAMAVLTEVRGGARKVVLHANSHAEIATALDLAEAFGFQPILMGGADCKHNLERLRQTGAWVALDALGFRSPSKVLELPALLEQQGITFAFTGDSGDQLRIAAALAVRYGASRTAALAAITRLSAEILQVADRVGSLRAGRQADFLVFSGDPLDLQSTLKSVYLAGKLLTSEKSK